MQTRAWWIGGTAVAAVLGSLFIGACAGPGSATRPTGAGAAHPEIDAGLDTCFTCHARVTPQVATQWRESRHGLDLVECVVCHGSTGADFRARPQTTGCAGCHAAQTNGNLVAALQSCFRCHPPHSLHATGTAMPHPPKPQEAAR